MLCEDWSNLLMQSEQDETRLFKGKKKKKKSQPHKKNEFTTSMC